MDHLRATIEKTSGSGFSDWKRIVTELGNHSLTTLLDRMDSEPANDGRNSHHAIHDKLRSLDLPTESCCFVSIGNFLDDPEEYFSQIPDGDYYFVSIKPGTHLAHATSKQQIVDFATHYLEHAAANERDREMYISHNSEAVMSGHIIIGDDERPNSINAEFTIGNFNAFHRGFHTPEISFNRVYPAGSNFSFQGGLATNEDWRTDEQFECIGNIRLTRSEMADYINQSLHYIPHDDDYYMPEYYEVLLEKANGYSVRPVFIEAVVEGID